MIFEFEFMRKAFFVGILLSVILPCIGTIVVLKKLSLIGDALSHTSLAGVALGLVIGQSPVTISFILCIVASLLVEIISSRMPDYADVSIAVISSLGIGIAGVLSGFIKNAGAFNAFLFGSIVAVSDSEILLICITAAFVILSFILLYKELMYIAFDEEGARISGVDVKLCNFIFTILTALAVSISARTVGALMVTSLIVLPVATGISVARSYKSLVMISIAYALVEVVCGLTVSYFFAVKPGGTITIISVIFFAITALIKAIFRR